MKEISDCEYTDLTRQSELLFKKVDDLKKDIKNKKFYSWLTFGTLVFVIGSFFIAAEQRDYWKTEHQKLKTELITFGYAQYNPTNGNWQLLKP